MRETVLILALDLFEWVLGLFFIVDVEFHEALASV